jgi:hypothetical protein
VVLPRYIRNDRFYPREILFQKVETDVQAAGAADTLDGVRAVLLYDLVLLAEQQHLGVVGEGRVPVLGQVLCWREMEGREGREGRVNKIIMRRNLKTLQ